jgi:hypothetical protein
MIGRGGDGCRTAQCGISVAIITEVPLGLQQRQHDPRRTVI